MADYIPQNCSSDSNPKSNDMFCIFHANTFFPFLNSMYSSRSMMVL